MNRKELSDKKVLLLLRASKIGVVDFDKEDDKRIEEDFNWLLDNDFIQIEYDKGNRVSYSLKTKALTALSSYN